jgi:hypothetical protein
MLGFRTITRAVARQQRRTYHAPLKEMQFCIHEVHDFQSHHKTLKSYAECDKETVDMVVEATAQLCEQELVQSKVDSDRIGCKWVDEVGGWSTIAFIVDRLLISLSCAVHDQDPSRI